MKKLLAIGTAAVVYIASVFASVRVEALNNRQAAAPIVSGQAVSQASLSREPAGSLSGSTTAAVSSTTDSTSEAAVVTDTTATDTTAAPTTTAAPREDAWYLSSIPLSKELQEFTYRQCLEKGVSYPLVLGVMEVESDFRTGVVREGDEVDMVGIMQLNSRYLDRHYLRYGVDDAYDPKDNIIIGVGMLADSIEKNGTVYALMEYNMGIVNMRKKRDAGIKSTGYTRKVMAAQAAYARQLEEQGLAV